MKNLNTLFFLLLCVCTLQVQAQTQEFLDPIYDPAPPMLDITYGVNATVLALAQAGEAIPEALKLDFYAPDNSSEARPTVLYLHTGNFLPQPDFCNLYGTRIDPMILEFKDELVARGYNVVVMDYRLGWNPLAATPPDRTAGLINAAYRGVQDLRNAIRFFRDDAANDNVYKVDVDKFVAWGDGTGAYVVYAAHAIDNYPQLVLPKFSVDTPLGPVPMVIESINGNPDGTSVGIVTAPFSDFLPYPEGDTLNYVNYPDYDSDFALGVAMGGAVGDISWVTADDVPLISYHVPNDSLAPYTEFTLTVPTNCELVVEVQGAYLIQEKLNELGVNDVFKLSGGQEFRPPYNVYTDRANQINDGFEGLFPYQYQEFDQPSNCFSKLTVAAPWQWWDPNDFIGQFCQLDPDNDLHTIGLAGNPLMSEAQGLSYVDSTLNYFLPRACLALGLDCGDLIVTSVKNIEDQQVGLEMSPNPATDFVQFTTETSPIERISLHDVVGKVIANYEVNANNFQLQRNTIPNGMYIAQLHFAEGVIAKKIMFE